MGARSQGNSSGSFLKIKINAFRYPGRKSINLEVLNPTSSIDWDYLQMP